MDKTNVFHTACAMTDLALLDNGPTVDVLLRAIEAAAIRRHVGAGGARVVTGRTDRGRRADDPVVCRIGGVRTRVEGGRQHSAAQRQRVACIDMATQAVGQISRILDVGLVVDVGGQAAEADDLQRSGSLRAGVDAVDQGLQIQRLFDFATHTKTA